MFIVSFEEEGGVLRYLHTMVRIGDVKASMRFYCELLGLRQVRRRDSEGGRYTIYFLAAPGDEEPRLELTHNWDETAYQGGRNFGHIAFEVDDIYALCQRLLDGGVTIHRPPQDGRMAFVRSPDGISVELLQRGEPQPPSEPWSSMATTGSW